MQIFLYLQHHRLAVVDFAFVAETAKNQSRQERLNATFRVSMAIVSADELRNCFFL